MITNTRLACSESGMPLAHASCFQQVANETDCVIASRSVGRYATGLILESYASKGFHVKAKSCDWGPMAGFVLADPRFTKRGSSPEARAAQREDIHNAKADGAGEAPIFISEARRQALEAMRCVTTADGSTINERRYIGRSPSGEMMKFVLRREMFAPGADGIQMWAVCYGEGETSLPSSPKAPQRPKPGSLLPVMAMVDPLCPAGVRNTYRAAMTGDYDLWAVFPRAGRFKPNGADKRPVPGSSRFNVPIKTFAETEDHHMGNITGRVRGIKNRLNARIRTTGYSGGDMVHHSDEAGRPLVAEVELKFIAFIPNAQEALFISTIADLGEFMRRVVADYHITFNPGWQKQLGFSVTPSGNFEV